MQIERRLAELGIELPVLPGARGNYVAAKRIGDIVYLSGKGPRNPDGTVAVGKLGAEFGVQEGYGFARQTGLILIATMKDFLGDLDKVESIVKVLGLVNATPDFEQHPAVINGCSDLFVEIFGERGRHARSAIGVGSLPSGMPVEIEAVISVR